MPLAPVLRLMRPHQWTKNVLVFGALLFAGELIHPDPLVKSLLAFVALCLLSSATYVLNDLRDVERDRAHPTKRRRPIASGEVTPPVAWGLAVVLGSAGLIVAWLVGIGLVYTVLVYAGLQALYNLWWKRIALADVFLIAVGFVLRAIAGAVAIQEAISGWLILCTAALALLVGFGKRRHEFLLQGQKATDSRESLSEYNEKSLDALTLVMCAAACMCYGIYAVESPTALKYPGLILTVPVVWYAACRYLLLVLHKDEGGEPENLLTRDPQIVLCIILFVGLAILALSGLPLPWMQRLE